MYTDKKNILQLAALLKAHGIRRIVLCPGSRDIPIVQTLARMPEFTCYPVTDERSAGFFALGLALNENRPAAVCCTSGSALLNLHPAVAEAFYQQVPLVVLSADRPGAWIGQMDGQTLPQPGVFGGLVKKSVSLPEIKDSEDEWFCNRLINEALLELNHHGQGPVHINIPVSQPFFNFPTAEIPPARVISRYEGNEAIHRFIRKFKQYSRRMMVVGQMNPKNALSRQTAEALAPHFAWMTENISNQAAPPNAIRHIEPVLAALGKDRWEEMRPDLLVTYGGHIISGRLKKFLRSCPPAEHWHIAPKLDEADFPFSEMGAVGKVMHSLPPSSVLHLANSSVVRYAQLFNLPPDIEVLSNRGTNGIEGSLSTAAGYASASGKLNFVLIGDLSFFYDMNALWNSNYGNNLRILLLNNSGGEIFHALPGLEVQPATTRFVIASHQTSARAWAEDRGFRYLSARNEEELEDASALFTQETGLPQPLLLEVFTDKEKDVELLKTYYHNLKK